MWEMKVFEDAIAEASKLVDFKETLFIMTADHSHSMAFIGEPSRFDSVLLLDKGKGPMVSLKEERLYLNLPLLVKLKTRFLQRL